MPRGRPKTKPDDALIKSAELIGWALGGLEREIVMTRERLSSLTAQAAKLRDRIGRKGGGIGAVNAAAAQGATEEGRKRRRRRMSPEARKRISEMMKKRWAERRRGK